MEMGNLMGYDVANMPKPSSINLDLIEHLQLLAPSLSTRVLEAQND